MATTMCMSGYEIEREVVALEEYGDEVMCAEWNPQLVLVSELPLAQADRHVPLPAELANVDVDDFLEKMYRYQH